MHPSETRVEGTAVPRRVGWIVGICVALAAALPLLGNLGYGIFGQDSYPLLRSARVGGFRELVELLTAPFIGGDFGAAYHRPVLALLLAFEQTLFGLEPRGYHAVQIAGWTCMALSAAWLARVLFARMAPSAPAWLVGIGSAFAGLLLAWHPLAIEIVPVLSRQHDPLMISLSFAGFALLLRSNSGGLAACVAGAAFTAGAGIKETGYLVAPLAALVVFIDAPGSIGARVHMAARRTLPAFVGLAVLFGLRCVAIGGVGGGSGEARWELVGRGLFHALAPQPVLWNNPISSLLVALELIAIGLTVGVGWMLAQRRRALSAAVVLGLGLALIGALLPASQGRLSPWHPLLPAAGFALLSALGLVAAVDVARSRRGVMQVPLAAALLIGLLPLWRMRLAPVAHHYTEWERGARALAEFQASAEQRLERAQAGEVIELGTPPVRVPRSGTDPSKHPAVLRPAVFSPRSAVAWIDLRFGSDRVRATGPMGRLGRMGSHVIAVLEPEPEVFVGPSGELRHALAALRELGPDSKAAVQRFQQKRGRGDLVTARATLIDAVAATESARAHAPAVRDYLLWIGDSAGVALLDERVSAG